MWDGVEDGGGRGEGAGGGRWGEGEEEDEAGWGGEVMRWEVGADGARERGIELVVYLPRY